MRHRQKLRIDAERSIEVDRDRDGARSILREREFGNRVRRENV
jgi:hypothetical protein